MKKKLELIKRAINEYHVKALRVDVYMCAAAFEMYFKLFNDKVGTKYTIVVTDVKPRGSHDNVYHLVRPPYDDECYAFGPNEEDANGDNSPWDLDFDLWLNRHFKGKDVYVWIE